MCDPWFAGSSLGFNAFLYRKTDKSTMNLLRRWFLGTPKKDATDEASSENIQRKLEPDPDPSTDKSESADFVSGELQKTPSPDAETKHRSEFEEVSIEIQLSQGINVLQSNREDGFLFRVREKPSENVRNVPQSYQEDGSLFKEEEKPTEDVISASQSDQDDGSLSKVQEVASENVISALQSNHTDVSHSILAEKPIENVSQSNQEDGSLENEGDQQRETYSIRHEKALEKLRPRRNADTSAHTTLSTTPEKSSEDGYNWHKYSQKRVRGSEFTRSYYKCMYPNCQAKKQVVISNDDGQSIDVYYIGKHGHTKTPSGPNIAGEGEKSRVPGETCQPLKPQKLEDKVNENGGRYPKRRKREIWMGGGDTRPRKLQSEPQDSVPTMSEVDEVDDGYHWRKYGQKCLKGNPNPRCYYKCASPGCPVKKHVERTSHDSNLVITTYDGQHDHDIISTSTPSSKEKSSSKSVPLFRHSRRRSKRHT